MEWMVLSVIAGAVLAAGLSLVLCYKRVGPNEVLIVSGRRGTFVDPATGEQVVKAFKVYHGGGTLVLPVREKVDVMSVELMTLEIKTPEFFTKFGVPIVVDGIAQIKVISDDPVATATAAEMFLSKSRDEMNEIAHQMMQGHLRAVISTLPFEEIHANPEAFAQTVQRLTAADLGHMGIQVVSFTIREVQDPSGYLQALGRPQLANVEKDASVGEANAERDAQVGRSLAEREATVTAARARQDSELARVSADLEIANAEAAKNCRVEELGSEVARAKAASDMSYELQKTKEARRLAEARVEVQKAERQGLIEMEQLEIGRRELELVHTVRKPTDAERERIEVLAAAEGARRRATASADAEAARLRGLAEAEVIRARGEAEALAVKEKALAEAEGLRAKLMAEAEGMQERARAWEHYNAAAVSELFIEKLPEIATAVAKPLERVERIVLVNTGEGSGTGVERITRSVTELLTQVPGVAELMRSIDLGELVRSLPSMGSRQAAPEPAPAPATKPLAEPARDEGRAA